MADKRISELPATGALLDAGVFAVEQAGVTVKVTAAQVIARSPVESVNARTGAVTLTDTDVPATAETEASASDTLAQADAGKYRRWTNTGAKVLNVATNATAAIVTGSEFHIRNAAASGDLTITPAGGVTINPPKGGSLLLEPGDTVTLKKVATDTWDLFGSTALA